MRLKCLVFWTRNVQPSTTNHVMVLPIITVRSPQVSNHLNHRAFIQVPLTKVSFKIINMNIPKLQNFLTFRFRNIFYFINHS